MAGATPAKAGRPASRRRRTVRSRGWPVLLAAAAALATALPGGRAMAAAAGEPLRVCADPDNLPFSSAEGGGRGISLEIAQLVADALGRPLEPVWTVTVFGKRASGCRKPWTSWASG